jgi:hypothetical protein
MTLGIGSLTRRLTRFIRVYKKKVELTSILTFSEFKVRRQMEKEICVVLEKMDPHYSFGGLS